VGWDEMIKSTRYASNRSTIPYQLNPVQRLTDPYVVLVEGAVLITEDE
jgi:hypothetical protein